MAAPTSPVAAPAGGRRRFWLTVTAFAIANALAWVGFHYVHELRKPAMLRVERFSHADGGVVAARPRLAWTFNLDVAPNKTGEPAGSIVPAVPGKWSWPDRRTLTFTPDGDLPKATRFTVAIPAD